MPEDPSSSTRAARPASRNDADRAAIPPALNGNLTSHVAVTVKSRYWSDALPFVITLGEEAVREILCRELGEDPAAWPEVSLVFADDAFVQSLNKAYRGRDKPTNVLSFPCDASGDDDGVPALLGDVVLGFGVIRDEAHAQGKSLADHVMHLIVHGTLHLLGYDHQQDADATLMEARETDILKALGVTDPYVTDTTGQADSVQSRGLGNV